MNWQRIIGYFLIIAASVASIVTLVIKLTTEFIPNNLMVRAFILYPILIVYGIRLIKQAKQKVERHGGRIPTRLQ